VDHRITWFDWQTDAFARARDERKAVLFSLSPPWSAPAARMDADVYAHPTIARLVAEHYVAVRVDPDRRPDIAARYQLGAWPTTALLTPGGFIISGGTFVPRERFEPLLTHAASEIASRWDELQVIPAPDLADIPREPVDTVAVHLALDEFRHNRSSQHEALATRTLDAIAAGELRDAHERLLGRLAALLRAFLDGFATLGFERYRDAARDIVTMVQNEFADGADGGWAASRHADGALDATLFTDWNAAMASAMLAAAQMEEDTSLRDYALKSIERVLLASYRPGHGVAHVAGGDTVRGLLLDHLACADAMLDAHEVTENVPYEMMAEELAHYVLRVLADEDGGLRDRTHDDGADVGLLRLPFRPVAENCHAARLLSRVARASGNHEFHDHARRTLAAIEPRARGPLAAHFALAVRAVGER
jgi:hypothetical protein